MPNEWTAYIKFDKDDGDASLKISSFVEDTLSDKPGLYYEPVIFVEEEIIEEPEEVDVQEEIVYVQEQEEEIVEESTGMSGGAIAGIIIGVIVALSLICYCFFGSSSPKEEQVNLNKVQNAPVQLAVTETDLETKNDDFENVIQMTTVSNKGNELNETGDGIIVQDSSNLKDLIDQKFEDLREKAKRAEDKALADYIRRIKDSPLSDIDARKLFGDLKNELSELMNQLDVH